MTPRSRKKINSTDEATLLMACRRRCCLCAFYKSDYSQKRGQIAHIDKDRSNAAISNLAFLCLECHDAYDSTSSQSKNYTQKEVRSCKDKLEAYFAPVEQLQVNVSLTLNLTPDELEEKRSEIQRTIAETVGREMDSMNLRFAAERIDLTLDERETQLLADESEDGHLGNLCVREFAIVDVTRDLPHELPTFGAYFGEDYLEEFVTASKIVEAFEAPNCQAHFDTKGEYCSYDDSVLSIYVRSFGSGSRQYAILVFVVRSETSTARRNFHPAVRLYRKEFGYTDSWSAADYANAFAKKYGADIRPFGKKIILPVDRISGLVSNAGTVASTSFRGPYHYIAMQRKDFLGVTHVYLMLIVDIVRYAKSLRQHGVKLTKSFKKKLRTKDRYPSDL